MIGGLVFLTLMACGGSLLTLAVARRMTLRNRLQWHQTPAQPQSFMVKR